MNPMNRFVLLMSLLMSSYFLVDAQVDVTAQYMQNPSFEEGASYFHDLGQPVPGWSLQAASKAISFRNDDGDGTQDGRYLFGVWSLTEIGDFELLQTLTNVPAGTYIVRCLMTVPVGNYTTQRLFARVNSHATNVMYFGSNAKFLVPGELPQYAGLPIDGTGQGPFHSMSLKINVEKGDTLQFGIRTNGKKSLICPFSKLNGEGWFMVDGFRLLYVADDVAHLKGQIQEALYQIQTFNVDSLPGGYAGLIQSKILECRQLMESLTDADSLENCRSGIKRFTTELENARLCYAKLSDLMLNCERLTTISTYLERDALIAKLAFVRNVFYSSGSLMLDFDAAYNDLYAAAHTYYDCCTDQNLALFGIPTTSFVSAWEKLSAVNDGFEPKSSIDRSHFVYGNWNGNADYGKTNWVQYEWPYFQSLTSASVYWFTDFGGLSKPEAATIEYWKDQTWVSAGSIDTALNTWNTLNLSGVSSRKIRVCFHSLTSTGILEFKVMGRKKMAFDANDYKSMISNELALINELGVGGIPNGYVPTIVQLRREGAQMVSTMDSLDVLAGFYLNLTDFRSVLEKAHGAWVDLTSLSDSTHVFLTHTSYPNKDLVQKAYQHAMVVRLDTASMLADFIAARDELQLALDSYTTNFIPMNLASEATVSTSFVSPWELLSAVNDGYMPLNSSDNSRKKYGNWKGEAFYGATNWVQYDWTTEKSIKGASVYWFTDLGGMMLPDTAFVEYWNGSVWKFAGNIGVVANKFNELPLEIQTTKLRLSMKSVTSTGILEFGVSGYVPKTPDPIFTGISTDSVAVANGKDVFFPIQTTAITPADSILSCQFTVSYDTTKLSFVDFLKDSSLTMNGLVSVNHAQNGILNIAYIGTDFLSGKGTLFKLKFHATGTGVTTPVVSNFYYNAHVIPVRSKGSIRIFDFYGDVDGNNLVQAYDAALVLRNSVGADPIPTIDAIPWSDWRVVASDVDGNNVLTAFDAGLILQKSVYGTSSFPIQAMSATGLRSATSADVTMSREGNGLVFRSYGELVGLNVRVEGAMDHLGSPTSVNNSWMNAVRITNETFDIGFATATPPADGSVILILPIVKPSESAVTFHLTINNGLKDLQADLSTGLITEKEDPIQVYPNPVHASLTIELGTHSEGTVKMVDLLGQTVYRSAIDGTKMVINTTEFAKPGVYILNVLDSKNRVVLTKKVIKI